MKKSYLKKPIVVALVVLEVIMVIALASECESTLLFIITKVILLSLIIVINNVLLKYSKIYN